MVGRKLQASHPVLGLAFLVLFVSCERIPTEPASSPDDRIRGVVFADWTSDGYAGSSSAAELINVFATGADMVSILVTAYQSSPTSNVVRARDPRTPTLTAVDNIVTRARGLGLETSLKLHVDLDDGSWRGMIDPEDPDAWFSSYRSFILPWIDFAEDRGLTLLVVGTELATTIQYESRWRELISDVRSRYSGVIVYGASWDEAGRVPFWDALDLVGVDFYLPVARRRDPGRLEILSEWQPWLHQLALLHEQTGKKILFTEIGYRSVDGAGLHPYAFENAASIDLQEQADLYWAALEASGSRDWIAGMLWWNWLAGGGGGPDDQDFTPKGKMAEGELTLAWSGT